MIGMKDDHVMHIINDAPTRFEVAYNMDERVSSHWSFQPAVTKMNTFDILRILDLHK